MQGIVYQRRWKHFIQHHDGVLDGNLLQLPVNVEAARTRIGVEFVFVTNCASKLARVYPEQWPVLLA